MVVHGQTGGGRVHHSQVPLEHLVVGDAVKLHCVGVLGRVAVVHAVDVLGQQDDVRVDLRCTQYRRGIRGEKRADFRFLKILIIVPLGAIACSTMAGNRMVSHTMSTYCKYFLSCVFEAVTMALAIVVCNAFINAGLPSFTGSYADWAQTLIYLCEMTFTIAMTVGSVKGAQTLTSKAFGL